MLNAAEQLFLQIKEEWKSNPVTGFFHGLKDKLAGRPLAVYGAGAIGNTAFRMLSAHGIGVDAVGDSYKQGVHSLV